ncbi:hypothetical protein FACS189445_6740 [Spirochaetia bacterium]|nr:hypothetical protein FACS189445_6740 [Spirochaetia bacterium]
MLQDETAGMTLEEKASYHRRNATDLFASQGLPLPQYVNLSGQGKLKPREVKDDHYHFKKRITHHD